MASSIPHVAHCSSCRISKPLVKAKMICGCIALNSRLCKNCSDIQFNSALPYYVFLLLRRITTPHALITEESEI